MITMALGRASSAGCVLRCIGRAENAVCMNPPTKRLARPSHLPEPVFLLDINIDVCREKLNPTLTTISGMQNFMRSNKPLASNRT